MINVQFSMLKENTRDQLCTSNIQILFIVFAFFELILFSSFNTPCKYGN